VCIRLVCIVLNFFLFAVYNSLLESAYSKPAALSIFRRIGQLSVVSCSQNRSSSLNTSPSMRDEHRHPEHRPFVLFSSPISNICSQSPHDATIVHIMFFRLRPVYRLFCSLVRHASYFYTSYGVPFITLINSLLRDINAILQITHTVLHKHHKCLAVLSWIAIMQFSLCRHDFSAFRHKSMKFHSHFPFSFLQCLSCICWYQCRLAKLSRRLSRLQFCLAHKQPQAVFNTHISTPPDDFFSTSLPSCAVTLLGGGHSTFSWPTLQPYVMSIPPGLSKTCSLCYIHQEKYLEPRAS